MPTSCEIKRDASISSYLSELDTSIPYVNSVYYDKIEPVFIQYQNSVSADSARESDSVALAESTATANQFIAAEMIRNPNFTTLYPNLITRLDTAPLITEAEVQTVIDTSFLTYDTFGDYTSPYTPLIPSLFDDYYSPGSFSGSGMSSFCALVPNIFASYTNASNAFTDILGYATKFNNILSSIQDFSMSGLLESLKQQALSAIDSIVDKVKAIINQITGLFTKTTNYKNNLGNVYSKMHNEKQKVDQVTSDSAVENLKTAVSGAMSFATSLFESLKLEEIQFIILRFCELISGIENFFTDLTKPLQDIPDNFAKSYDFIKAAGFGGSARASAAGAFRISSPTRASTSQTIDAMPTTVTGGQGVTYGDEGTTIEGGVETRSRAYKVSPISDTELAILNNEMSFESVANGGSSHVELIKGQSYSIDGPAVWTKVKPLEKIMLYRLSVRLGKKILVNSAYRSSYAQSMINPKVTQSWHSSGQAFDVRMSSYSGMTFEEFKGHANSVGFSRVRAYNSQGFVHIDTGPPSQMW